MSFKQLIRNGEQQRSAGFTLIEVLIAMVIFSIGILAVAKMQIAAINSNANARKLTEAGVAAQEQIESLMSIPFAGMPMPSAGTPSSPIIVDTVNADGFTIRTIYSIDADGDGVDDADLDLDGNNDIMRIDVIIFDPLGIEKRRVSFLKAAII